MILHRREAKVFTATVANFRKRLGATFSFNSQPPSVEAPDHALICGVGNKNQDSVQTSLLPFYTEKAATDHTPK
jgi:hypothetical protein